jgi:hypothetical protein
VREVVHQTSRLWNLDGLEQKEERGCLEDGENLGRGGKTQQRYVQDLLSLDFMVREWVYLADESLTS